MQQNNRNRSFKIITAIALCVAVLCLSVAYAALSQQLEIKGTATVEGSNWSIHGPGNNTEITPDSNDDGEKVGDGDMTGKVTDTGNGTVSVQITASLKKPGDSATIMIPIDNDGDIDAHLDSVTGLTTGIDCSGTDETADADEAIMCTNAQQKVSPGPGFKYTIYYNDTAVDSSNWSTAITGVNRNLAKNGGQAKIKVKVEFDENATVVPTGAVTVTLPEITFSFQQGALTE